MAGGRRFLIATEYRRNRGNAVSHRTPSHQTPRASIQCQPRVALVGRGKRPSTAMTAVPPPQSSNNRRKKRAARFANGHDSRIVFMTPEERDQRREKIMNAVLQKGRRLTAPSAADAREFCRSGDVQNALGNIGSTNSTSGMQGDNANSINTNTVSTDTSRPPAPVVSQRAISKYNAFAELELFTKATTGRDIHIDSGPYTPEDMSGYLSKLYKHYRLG